MATLKLKATPATMPPRIAPRNRKLIQRDFSNHKSNAAILQFHRRREKSLSYEEVFGAFKSHIRSTGEDMVIIRAARDRYGFEEIPEEFTFTGFANIMQLRRRRECAENHLPHPALPLFCKRQHFDGRRQVDQVAARRLIRAYADRYLPDLLESKAA
jgi:hypothetical protein